MSVATAPNDLAGLQDRVEKMSASAGRRKRLLTVVGVVLAAVTIGYLFWAWSQIDKQLDAPTVVALAEQQAAPFLEQPAAEWAGYLEDQAPALIDQAAAAALEAPPQLTDQLLTHVDTAIEERMPELESQFEQLVTQLVDQAAEAAGDDFKNGEFDDAKAAELVDRVSSQFETSLQEQVDGMYGRYLEISSGMIDQLDKLSAGEGLSEKEQLHRDLVTSFLGLVQRAQSQAR